MDMKRSEEKNSGSQDESLHWMYNKPDGKVQEEDYLLGKAIDANYDKSEIQEQDVIPAVARRIVGSSMLTTSNDSQVDLARKLREDPLIMVKERERAARAALLNNPIQRRRLTELLKKEQEQRQVKKEKKKKSDLDSLLAAKITALGGEKKLNLDALLASDDSDSDTDEKSKSKKKKKKKAKDKKKDKKSAKKKNKQRSPSVSDEAPDRSSVAKSKSIINEDHNRNKETYEERERRYKHTSQKERPFESKSYTERPDRSESRKPQEYKRRGEQPETKHKVSRMSSEERSARLASMAAAGRERERERGERARAPRPAASPPRRAARAPLPLPATLHARLHSARHYHQRGDHHMNEHFARR